METLDRKITRTKLLKLGGVALGGAALGGAALMLPMERAAKTKLAISNRIPTSRLPKPFQLPFAVPPSRSPCAATRTRTTTR